MITEKQKEAVWNSAGMWRTFVRRTTLALL